MTIPTPADEALAREIERTCCISNYQFKVDITAAAQLIAAHVAAQAPSGLASTLLKIVYDECGEGESWRNAGTNKHFNVLRDIILTLAAHKAQPVADVRDMMERNEYLEKLFARMGTIRASAKPLGMELVGKQLGCEELVGIALAYAANWFSDDAPKFEKVLEFAEFISSNSHSTAALASSRLNNNQKT